MSTKFTPGPWSVFEHRDHSGLCIGPRYTEPYFTDGEVSDVCTISGGGRAVDDLKRANALLISAAPDLFLAIFHSDDAHWTPAMRSAMKKAVGEQ